MPDHIFFYLALGFLFTHELDAIRCKEWLMFPLTSWLKDDIGYAVFTLAHIPLFAWVLWSLAQSPLSPIMVRSWDIFCIVHVGLHILFLKHPENRFTTGFSWCIIVGAGVCGAVDLIL
ncbi:MAG: hypothetical protein MUF71_08365 [Candidatus Kapabacteria bacterium]|jgi:hypothetical protein|nr:hypothetical protein [Candidatus Kapabacteria bacterium]